VKFLTWRSKLPLFLQKIHTVYLFSLILVFHPSTNTVVIPVCNTQISSSVHPINHSLQHQQQKIKLLQRITLSLKCFSSLRASLVSRLMFTKIVLYIPESSTLLHLNPVLVQFLFSHSFILISCIWFSQKLKWVVKKCGQF
jgi:hypothetical protein